MSEENNFYNEAGRILSGESEGTDKHLGDLNKIWSASASYSYAEDENTEEAWQKFSQENLLEQKETFRVSWIRRNFAAVAASAALLMVGGIGVWLNKISTEITTPSIAFSTGNNEFKTVELTDGTVVSLNSNSQITITDNFNGVDRKVILKGEAVFEVASNPEKPFTVVAGSTQTRVLGTGFKIQAYLGECVAIDVLHGKVAFSANKQELTLTKGDGAVLNAITGEMSKYASTNISSWKNGEWILKKVTVSEIGTMFKHRFNKVLVYNEKDGNRIFTGKFAPQTSAEEIAKTIATALQIELSVR